MAEDNFYIVGRALQQDYPEYFNALATLVAQTESQALNDVEQLPILYNTYCSLIGINHVVTKRPRQPLLVATKHLRQPLAVANQRKLFIAVAVYLYDPMYFNGYSGRMRDKLRFNLSCAMECLPEWVSNVLPDLIFEYNHLSAFQMQVNLIAYYLRKQAQSQAA